MSIVLEKEQLLTECRNVSILEAQGIIARLEAELAASPTSGIGLAANQIGIDAKVCIIRPVNPTDPIAPIDLVNPVIQELHDLREFDNEGCLSFPNEWLVTKRYNEVVVKDDLHPAGIICTGLEAVVVQHEVGHLYGEVMYDYQIKRPGPNMPCWCGSGKKYKKCHSRKQIT